MQKQVACYDFLSRCVRERDHVVARVPDHVAAALHGRPERHNVQVAPGRRLQVRAGGEVQLEGADEAHRKSTLTTSLSWLSESRGRFEMLTMIVSSANRIACSTIGGVKNI